MGESETQAGVTENAQRNLTKAPQAKLAHRTFSGYFLTLSCLVSRPRNLIAKSAQVWLTLIRSRKRRLLLPLYYYYPI